VLVRHGHHLPAPSREKPLGAKTGESLLAASVRSRDWSRSNNSSASASTPSVRLPGPELPHVLMLPDVERADRIGEFWSYPQSRAFAELSIDCEEDRTLRAVLVGMLREAD
jgi:hypothetical protein